MDTTVAVDAALALKQWELLRTTSFLIYHTIFSLCMDFGVFIL